MAEQVADNSDIRNALASIYRHFQTLDKANLFDGILSDKESTSSKQTSPSSQSNTNPALFQYVTKIPLQTSNNAASYNKMADESKFCDNKLLDRISAVEEESAKLRAEFLDFKKEMRDRLFGLEDKVRYDCKSSGDTDIRSNTSNEGQRDCVENKTDTNTKGPEAKIIITNKNFSDGNNSMGADSSGSIKNITIDTHNAETEKGSNIDAKKNAKEGNTKITSGAEHIYEEPVELGTGSLPRFNAPPPPSPTPLSHCHTTSSQNQDVQNESSTSPYFHISPVGSLVQHIQQQSQTDVQQKIQQPHPQQSQSINQVNRSQQPEGVQTTHRRTEHVVPQIAGRSEQKLNMQSISQFSSSGPAATSTLKYSQASRTEITTAQSQPRPLPRTTQNMQTNPPNPPSSTPPPRPLSSYTPNTGPPPVLPKRTQPQQPPDKVTNPYSKPWDTSEFARLAGLTERLHIPRPSTYHEGERQLNQMVSRSTSTPGQSSSPPVKPKVKQRISSPGVSALALNFENPQGNRDSSTDVHNSDTLPLRGTRPQTNQTDSQTLHILAGSSLFPPSSDQNIVKDREEPRNPTNLPKPSAKTASSSEAPRKLHPTHTPLNTPRVESTPNATPAKPSPQDSQPFVVGGSSGTVYPILFNIESMSRFKTATKNVPIYPPGLDLSCCLKLHNKEKLSVNIVSIFSPSPSTKQKPGASASPSLLSPQSPPPQSSSSMTPIPKVIPGHVSIVLAGRDLSDDRLLHQEWVADLFQPRSVMLSPKPLLKVKGQVSFLVEVKIDEMRHSYC